MPMPVSVTEYVTIAYLQKTELARLSGKSPIDDPE
jgi:hypothetical protein